MGDKYTIKSSSDTIPQVFETKPTTQESVAADIEIWSKENAEKILNSKQVSTFGEDIICEPDALKIAKPMVVDQIPVTVTNSAKLPEIVKKSYQTNSSFCPSEPMEIDEELFNQALNNILPKDSVLKDKGKTFLHSAGECVFVEEQDKDKPWVKHKKVVHEKDKKALDPFLLSGISLHESARGTSKMATDGRNNIAGLGLKNIKSVDSCIEYLGALIDTRVQNNKLTTVSQLAKSGKYCAKNAAPNWQKQVTNFAEKLRKEYNKLVEQKQNEMFESINLPIVNHVVNKK